MFIDTDCYFIPFQLNFTLRGSQRIFHFRICTTRRFRRLFKEWKCGTVPLVLGHATEIYIKTDG